MAASHAHMLANREPGPKFKTGSFFLTSVIHGSRSHQQDCDILNTLHSLYLSLQAAAQRASLTAVTQMPGHRLFAISKHMLLLTLLYSTSHTKSCKLQCRLGALQQASWGSNLHLPVTESRYFALFIPRFSCPALQAAPQTASLTAAL